MGFSLLRLLFFCELIFPIFANNDFPDRDVPGVFDIRTYGAVADGFLHNNTAAINAAVSAASTYFFNVKSQGFVLVAGGGVFLSGRINLLSGVILFVDEDTQLRASAREVDFGSIWAFIYSAGASDISVMGSGIIDGNWEAWIDGFDESEDR
jgi:polygalacturonase